MAKFSVILPGAGRGKRFGAEENKIFRPIRGRPIFMATLEAFASRPDVCQIQVVVGPDDWAKAEACLAGRAAGCPISLVPGGSRRSESVRNALAGVLEDVEFVCVHDAVRPCISPALIDAVFAEAQHHGAAILAYPVHGTLKKVCGELIEATVSREDLWEAQTPQVFRKDVLLGAYAGGTDATDDAHLVAQAGYPVHVVMGDPRNIKITTPGDLSLAEVVIDSLSQSDIGRDIQA